MKKIVVLLLILVFALTACGESASEKTDSAGGIDSEKSEKQEDKKVESKEEEKAAEPVELLFWSLDARDPERSVVEGTVADFNAQSDHVTINGEYIESESFKTKIKVAVAGNDMPDVFTYWTGGQFKTMVDAGVVADLTDVIEGDPDFKDIWLEGSFDVVTYDGKIYGIPNLASSVVIWYNKEIFDQYGLSVPETWTELIDVVDVLNENSVAPITVAGKDRWPLLHWFSYLSQRIGGVEPFEQIVAGENDFTDSSFVEAAQKLQELVEHNGFVNGYLGLDYGGAEAQFTSGNAAMYMQGDWAVGSLATDPVMSDKVSFFKFPEVEGGVGNPNIFHGGLGGCMAISADADLDAAFEFIKYYKQPSSVKPLVEAIGRPSAVKLDFADSEMEPLKAEYLSFFGKTPEGFFGYYDQQLEPQMAEKILNAIQAIAADPAIDAAAELSKVK